MSVSYTHLDVYKRQEVILALGKINIFNPRGRTPVNWILLMYSVKMGKEVDISNKTFRAETIYVFN